MALLPHLPSSRALRAPNVIPQVTTRGGRTIRFHPLQLWASRDVVSAVSTEQADLSAQGSTIVMLDGYRDVLNQLHGIDLIHAQELLDLNTLSVNSSREWQIFWEYGLEPRLVELFRSLQDQVTATGDQAGAPAATGRRRKCRHPRGCRPPRIP